MGPGTGIGSRVKRGGLGDYRTQAGLDKSGRLGVLGDLVVGKRDSSREKVDRRVGKGVVEEANRIIFEFLLDNPRREARHETEDVFEEE